MQEYLSWMEGDCMHMCVDWSDSNSCVIGYFTLDWCCRILPGLVVILCCWQYRVHLFWKNWHSRSFDCYCLVLQFRGLYSNLCRLGAGLSTIKLEPSTPLLLFGCYHYVLGSDDPAVGCHRLSGHVRHGYWQLSCQVQHHTVVLLVVLRHRLRSCHLPVWLCRSSGHWEGNSKHRVSREAEAVQTQLDGYLPCACAKCSHICNRVMYYVRFCMTPACFVDLFIDFSLQTVWTSWNV